MEPLPLRPSFLGCIIATFGYDFQKGQLPWSVSMISERHLLSRQFALPGCRASDDPLRSESRRMFELIEPIITHRFNDTIANYDEPGIGTGVGKVLVNGERRNVDEIAALPFEPLWFFVPIPGKGIDAVKFQVPMQIVTGAFSNENNLLPHMPMLARALARRKELHIGLNATFLGIETIVNEVLDEPVGAPLERHILGTDDI
jgi:hypothetical protein